MKSFACVVILYGLFMAHYPVTAAKISEIAPAGERSFSSQVVDALEALKLQMPCGFPKYGIPALAPLQFSHRTLKLDGGEFRMVGEFNNFKLLGLNEFEIQEFDINTILSKIIFKFNFGSLNFTTDYAMDMDGGLNFKRKGGAFFAFENLQISGSIKYSLGLLGGNGLRLKEFKIYVSLGNANSQIENLSSYRIINRKLNEVIEEWFMLAINDNTDYVAEWANGVIVPLANQMIGDRTIKDLIALIVGGGGGGGGSGNGGSSNGEVEKCVPPA